MDSIMAFFVSCAQWFSGGMLHAPVPTTTPPAFFSRAEAQESPEAHASPAQAIAVVKYVPAVTVPPAVASTPQPYNGPTVAPASPLPMPSFPVSVVGTSAMFTANTPFHHTVQELIAAGGTIRPHQVAENWWAGGRGTERPWDQSPVYIGSAGDPTYTVSCPMYGQCNATGLQIHLPLGAHPQMSNTDHHEAVIDPAIVKEVDLFLCPTDVLSARCGSGGAYPLTGPQATGLVVSRGALNSSGDAGGFAFGIMQFTGGEMFAASRGGIIPHALGMGVNCVDNTGPHYPSSHPADYYCGNLGRYGPNTPTPNVVYGDLLFLNPSYVVPAGASALGCAPILRTLKAYGAYVYDVAPSYGSSLHAESSATYAAGSNPWDAIGAAMVAAGEGSGSGESFRFDCIGKWTTSADWNVLVLNQGGDAALPPL